MINLIILLFGFSFKQGMQAKTVADLVETVKNHSILLAQIQTRIPLYDFYFAQKEHKK